MGWNTNEGYYQKHVKERGYSNAITEEQEAFNKLDLKDIKEGIGIVTKQLNKDTKDKNQTGKEER